MIYKIWSSIILIALVAVLATGCKKYADPPPYFEEIDSAANKKIDRRVLIIGIDGAVGSLYKTIAPPSLMAMTEHSKYSWDGLSDLQTTDAAGWRTLVSGVSFIKHNIKDSSFVFKDNGLDEDHTAIAQAPNFFNYIISSPQYEMRTAMVSSWKDLLNAVPEIARRSLAANDAAVKDSAVSIIKSKNDQLITVHFNGPAIAGKQAGFSATSAYKDAVLQVDTYIGEIMSALKARPQYNKGEDWLVIVTGTHGGYLNGYGGNTDNEIYVPTFYYHERMKKTQFTKEGAYTTARIYGKTTDASNATATLNGSDAYNMGKGLQTVQFNIKSSQLFNWPHFASKSTGWPNPQTPGWSIFQTGTGSGDWALSVMKGSGSDIRNGSSTGIKVIDGTWHTLTFSFFDSVISGVSTRWVKMFSDNVKGTVVKIDNYETDFVNPAPIYFGWAMDKNMGALDFSVAEIKIFNTSLTDQEIRSGLCLTDIKQHPKYNNLIGYWPGNDGVSNMLRNKIPSAIGNDFILSGKPEWLQQTEFPCSYSPIDPTTGIVSRAFKNVDVATTVFYWLKIFNKPTWNLEGGLWLNRYEQEFLR